MQKVNRLKTKNPASFEDGILCQMPESLGPRIDEDAGVTEGGNLHGIEVQSVSVHEILGFLESGAEDFANLLDALDLAQSTFIVVVHPG